MSVGDGPGRGPTKLGDVLTSYLEERGLGERLERAGIVEEWDERVGDEIARVTEPRRVSGNALIVAVRSSAWMAELDMMKPRLLERLNEGRERGRVEKLVFVLAEDDDGSEGRG